MKLKTQDGITLLEVMISMIIMGMGILGLAPLIVLSIEGNNISRDVMAVSGFAKEQIELYENADALPALPFKQYDQGLGDGYDRVTSIWDNASDTTIPPGYCRIEISITWTDKVGVARSTEYATLLSKE